MKLCPWNGPEVLCCVILLCLTCHIGCTYGPYVHPMWHTKRYLRYLRYRLWLNITWDMKWPIWFMSIHLKWKDVAPFGTQTMIITWSACWRDCKVGLHLHTTSHYLNQCPSSPTCICGTRGRWVIFLPSPNISYLDIVFVFDRCHHHVSVAKYPVMSEIPVIQSETDKMYTGLKLIWCCQSKQLTIISWNLVISMFFDW